jgi:hypothetical protein
VALFYSGATLACACCGADGTWNESISKYPNFPANIIESLALDNGVLNDGLRGDFSLSIEKVKLIENQYIFFTKNGYFVFTFDNEIVHRESNIEFITNPESIPSNKANIYHEIILSGTLDVSPLIVKNATTAKIGLSGKAKMIFQGLGNKCLQQSDFRKWLIKVEGVFLLGSGNIKQQT